jgi:hypothetical protein
MLFRYAIATGRAERDPSVDLRGALIAPKVSHRAAIVDPKGIGALLRAIDDCGLLWLRCGEHLPDMAALLHERFKGAISAEKYERRAGCTIDPPVSGIGADSHASRHQQKLADSI